MTMYNRDIMEHVEAQLHHKSTLMWKYKHDAIGVLKVGEVL